MIVQRGDVWLADLNPTQGSEQAGTRPVPVLQNDVINSFTTTILTIPLTTNLRRATLPSCVRVAKGEGGLVSDSIGLRPDQIMLLRFEPASAPPPAVMAPA